MLLKGNLTIHQRDSQYLAILADYPYWLVVNEAGKEILELCFQCSTFEEVASRFADLADIPAQESLTIVKEFLSPLLDHNILNSDFDTIDSPVNPILMAICINITRKCNLFCPHCYASGGPGYRNELSDEEIRTFLQEVAPFTRGTVQVQLTGGEPFLEEEKLFAAIDEVQKLKYNILIINTNGTLLNKENVDQLKSAVSHIEHVNISVSLDGATKKTHELIRGPDTFEKALIALTLLRDAGLPVAASIAVHQENFHELEDIFNLCMDLGVVPYTSPLAPLGRAQTSTLKPVPLRSLVTETYRIIKENNLPREKMSATYVYYIVQALRNLNRRRYCGSGLSTLFLDSNGDVYPCMNTLYQKAFKCGNIREMPFKNIWESPVYNNLRSLNIPESNEKCRICEMRYICAGYCRGVTHKVTGSIYAPFIWCKDFKKTLEEAMWILSEEPDLFKKQAREEFTRYGMW